MGLQRKLVALGKKLQLLPIIMAVFAFVIQPFYALSAHAIPIEELSSLALLSPTDDAVVDGKVLMSRWSNVSGATSYIYESYNDEAATKQRHTEVTTDTQKSSTNVPHGTTFWWRVKAISAHRESSWSTLRKVTVDATAPTIPTGGLPNDQFLKTNVLDFTWNASTDDRPGVTYEFQSAKTSVVDANNSLTNAWKSTESNDPEQNYLPNSRMSSKGVPEGKWFWQVRAVDATGNKSAWSDVWEVTLDTKAPKLKIKQPKNGQVFGDESTRTIVVEAYLEDEYGLENYNISIEPQLVEDEMQMTAMAKDQTACPASTRHGGGEVRLTVCTVYDTTEFYDGGYTITAWVEDKAGNRTTKTRTIVIRDEAMPILSTSLKNEDTLSDIAALTVTAGEANPKAYTIRVLDRDDKVVAGKNGEPQELHDSNHRERSFTYDWNTHNVYDGEYEVQFSATDAFGNESSISRLIHVDNTPNSGPKEVPTVVITEQRGRIVKGTISHASAALAVLIDGRERKGIVIQRTEGGFRWSFTLPQEFTRGRLQMVATLNDKSGYSDIHDFNFSHMEEVGNGSTGAGGLIRLEDDLLRPFTVPTSLRTSLVMAGQSTPALVGSDILGVETKSPEVDRNTTTPAIAATESGWKIFGLAWYWWFGSAIILAFISWRIISSMKHRADAA